MCVASLSGPDRPPADLSRLKEKHFASGVQRKEEREGGAKWQQEHAEKRSDTKISNFVCSVTCSCAKKYVSQTTT